MIQFWDTSARGKIVPEINKVYEFLSTYGFRGETIDGTTGILKITDKFVERVVITDVLIFFRELLLNEKSNFFKTYKNANPEFARAMWEDFTKFRWARIFEDKNYVNFEKLEVKLKRHNSKQAFFYFKNCFVEITAKGLQKHSYTKLDGFVFKDAVIDRDFNLIEEIDQDGSKEAYPGGWAFGDFLKKISQKSQYDADLEKKVITYDDEKLNYLKALMGFCIHDYKQQGDTDFAPVFCDDEAGGSGKGILIQAIAKLAKSCLVNARAQVPFDPIQMTKEVRVKVYNDCEKGFPFPLTYTQITEDGSIMHKFGNQILIPYSESYKLVFSSNFIIRGNLSADRRRQRIFDLHNFFSDKHTPKDQYGTNFFSNDWTDDDWNYFFTLMFQCCQEWLGRNYKLAYDNEDYNLRKLEDSYPVEFRKYIDGLNTGSYETGKLYEDFKRDAGSSPFVKKLNSNSFGRMVTNYLADLKIPNHKNGSRTELYINKEAAPTATAKKGDDLPF